MIATFAVQSCQSSQLKTSEANEKMGRTVSYATDIAPLFAQKCTPCHFPERGRKKLLNTHEAVKESIKDILYRVQLAPDAKDFMPFKQKKPALTSAEIKLLKDWVAQNMAG